MKKHTHLIRLIVITAALIGLGVIAFKYLHNIKSIPAKNNVVIQSNKSESVLSSGQNNAIPSTLAGTPCQGITSNAAPSCGTGFACVKGTCQALPPAPASNCGYHGAHCCDGGTCGIGLHCNNNTCG